MREYTRRLAGRPRGAGSAPGQHDTDQPVDELFDRRLVGALGDLLAQAEDHVVAVVTRWVHAFHRVLTLLPKWASARRPNLGSIADNGSPVGRLEPPATDPHRSAAARSAVVCGPRSPPPPTPPRPTGARQRPPPVWSRW